MQAEMKIFNYAVPSYSVWIIIGIVAGLITGLLIGRKEKIKSEDIIFAFTYGVLGAIIGGKALYLLVSIPWIIENFQHIIKNKEVILALFESGFVFYGGLVGGILGVVLYCKIYNIQLSKLLTIVAITIPLMHIFGRIGCFSVGCCYGIEYSGFGCVVFSNSNVAPNNISLFPVQLIEGMMNAVIFITLLIKYKKGIKGERLLLIYLLLYSLIRFCIEFLRGDSIRGIFFGLSTSQWISVFIIIAITIRKNMKKVDI